MSAFAYGWAESGSTNEPFWVRFNRCDREPRSWKEEIYATARRITNSTTKPLFLCFSGGIDSEIMCDAFFNQGIHFSVITVEHTAGTNRHDTAYARRWCQKRGVSQHIVQFDMPRFLSKDARAYADQGYVTGNVFRYFQIKLMEEVERLGGYAVFGGGEQLYRADAMPSAPKAEETYLEFESGYAVPLEWCKKNHTAHEPYFYFATPELVLSYLRVPIVAFATSNPDIFRHRSNAFLFKRLVYQGLWPSLEPRMKYSGYENIAPLRIETQKRLAETFGERIHLYRLPVKEMVEQLLPQK